MEAVTHSTQTFALIKPCLAPGAEALKRDWRTSQATPSTTPAIDDFASSCSSLTRATSSSSVLQDSSIEDSSSFTDDGSVLYSVGSQFELEICMDRDGLDGRAQKMLDDGDISQGAPARAVLAGADRANLVNWMAAAAWRLNLCNDVLFTAVGCLDELRLAPAEPSALVYGAACLWISAKWSLGARAPGASRVAAALPSCGCAACRAGGGGCGAAAAARRRLVQAEGEVLQALDFGARVLRRPTVETFLRPAVMRIQKPQQQQRRREGSACCADEARCEEGAPCVAAPCDLVPALCSLLAEESLLESQLLAFPPQEVAAACVAYAHALAGRPLTARELSSWCCSSGAPAPVGAVAAAASAAADVLRAVHAAVAAAAAAGNPYAASARWARLAPAALMVQPIVGAGDARLVPLAAAAAADGAAARWSWVLPDSAA